MNAKTGRPPADNPRNRKIEVRLNDDEAEKLDYCHKVTGKPRSEIIRDGIEATYAKLKNLKEK